jgi:transposase
MAPTTSYPSDVSDEEWAVAVPSLTWRSPTALQRKHDLRAVFNAARYLAHTGAPWRYLPSDFPSWPVVYQPARRWLAAGSFAAVGTTPVCCCARAKGARPSPAPSSWMRAYGNRRQNAVIVPAIVGANDARERRSMPPSIRWAIPWPCA